MSDAYIILDEPATTDKKLDAENVDGGTPPLIRERIQVTGALLAEIARVLNDDPAGTEYALIVRNIPSGTQAVSATSLPLPTGAATSAKQPALGTAGSAASDVLTVQGIASMTPLKMDGSGVTQPVSLAATVTVDGSGVTQPISGTVTVEQSTASSLKVDLSGTAANTTALKVDGSAVTQPVGDGGGSLTVDGTVAVSGTVTVDGSGSTQPVSAAVGSPVFVTPTPSTSGGWSVSSQTALSTTVASAKASAGTFGGYMLYNPNDAVSYVQVFDAASGDVTLGTTTPAYVIPIPAGSAANVEFTNGLSHATAISLAATTSATGSTALSSALTGFVVFK